VLYFISQAQSREFQTTARFAGHPSVTGLRDSEVTLSVVTATFTSNASKMLAEVEVIKY